MAIRAHWPTYRVRVTATCRAFMYQRVTGFSPRSYLLYDSCKTLEQTRFRFVNSLLFFTHVKFHGTGATHFSFVWLKCGEVFVLLSTYGMACVAEYCCNSCNVTIRADCRLQNCYLISGIYRGIYSRSFVNSGKRLLRIDSYMPWVYFQIRKNNQDVLSNFWGIRQWTQCIFLGLFDSLV